MHARAAGLRNIERILMKNTAPRKLSTTLLSALVILAGTVSVPSASAQNPEVQQQVSDVQQSMAKNKEALASYTWNEVVTISLKGEEKKQQHYQVRLGPDLKPQKTSLDPPPPPPSEERLTQ